MEENIYFNDGRIELSEEGIAYWSEKIGCTKQDLKNTINRIGNKYSLVLLYLELNRLITTKD